MSLLRKLEMAVDFSTSEKLIATYILKNGPDVLNMSTSQLAKATYTSPATITRLCQKLEYKGYNDFKIALSAQLQYTFDRNSETNPNFPFKKRDTIHTIKHSIATLAKDSINLTVNNIDNDILAKIIIMLDQTKVIDIYGVSGPLRIASDFQYKMFRIGKNVQIAPMVNEQLFQAAQSNKDHCAILISYSGETNEVIAAAELLKRRKVPMIAITSFGENRLSKLCDYVLFLDSRERIYSKVSTFGSTISIHIMLDIIYSCLFARHYDENLELKLETDHIIDHRHIKQIK